MDCIVLFYCDDGHSLRFVRQKTVTLLIVVGFHLQRKNRPISVVSSRPGLPADNASIECPVGIGDIPRALLSSN